jgi:hypothetical protein
MWLWLWAGGGGGLENWNWEFRSCKRIVVEERESREWEYNGVQQKVWELSQLSVGKSASEEPAWAGGCSQLHTLVPRSRIFLPWRWRRYVPPKRRFTQDPYGARSQKTVFFMVTAVKTSNLTIQGLINPVSQIDYVIIMFIRALVRS